MPLFGSIVADFCTMAYLYVEPGCLLGFLWVETGYARFVNGGLHGLRLPSDH